MKEDNIYKELEHIDDFKLFDVDQEWSAFLAKAKARDMTSAAAINDDSSKPNSTATVRKLPFRILSIAAGIAVLIGCFFFLSQDGQLDEKAEIVEVADEIQSETEEIVVAPDKKDQQVKEDIAEVKTAEFIQYQPNQVIELHDGSTVKVLAASSLNIPDSFEGLPERNIGFKSGNVEFSIVSNKNQPFRVLTDDSGIFVTGTTFRMKKTASETVVKTISGSVEMYSLENKSIKTVINAGEEFSYNGGVITEVIEEAPVIETETEKPVKVKMSGYPLSTIKDFAKDNFKDNLKIKRKAIDKPLLAEILRLPSTALNSGDISTVDVILKALQDQYNVDFSPLEGCKSCYEITSITKKD